jgi:N-acetylmuramoyl-L-alanine amidase
MTLALALAALALSSVAAAATVNNVRVWSGPESTRVVFELTGPVEHRVTTLSDPDRVVIDIADASTRAPLSLPEAKGLVQSLRTAARPGNDLRVVLELSRTARPKTFLLGPSEQYGHRLVVDLVGGAGAEAPPLVETKADVQRATSAPTLAAAGRDVIIAIDAGHGGEDPGASGRNGTREKDVVLAIAKRVAEEVDAQPGLHAVLIRSGDYFVPLRKRMELAHEAQADFFMSIHADAYRDASAKGATVYVQSDKAASDEASLLLAQRENAADLIGGVSLADKDKLLARVLLDLSQNAAISASMAASQRLIKRMSSVTTMRRMQVQQAPFLVLKSPDIPSLLVETAYISNPREEAGLRNPAQQTVLAKALCAGIVDYFAANPPQGSYFAHSSSPTPRTVKHVIVRGETLSGIAARYRVSAASIRRSNSLKSDVVRTGQVLTIPRT